MCVSGVSEDGGRVISAVVCMALCLCVCPEVKEISYRLALAPSLHHGAPLSFPLLSFPRFGLFTEPTDAKTLVHTPYDPDAHTQASRLGSKSNS